MTRLLVISLVLFPVVFIAMLVATGTLQDLILPKVKSRIQEKLVSAVPAPDETAPHWDVVDSLIVAGLDEREERVQASSDSLMALQARIATERRELSRMSQEIQALLGELKTFETTLEDRRESERQAFAKIFGAIDPEQAAEIIAYLDDESVEFLMKSLKKREAAEVLAGMDPARAARLSGPLLAPTDGKAGGVN
jgi:flagellar motility protein MotE (MotC chaperone)